MGTERRPPRTAMKSTCYNHSPGRYARDRATGPRGQCSAGPPGPRAEWPRTWVRNDAPRARSWRARAVGRVPASTRGTGPPGPGASTAAGPPGPRAEWPQTWGRDNAPRARQGRARAIIRTSRPVRAGQAAGSRGQYGRKAPGAPGRVATGVGAERRHTRAAIWSACYDQETRSLRAGRGHRATAPTCMVGGGPRAIGRRARTGPGATGPTKVQGQIGHEVTGQWARTGPGGGGPDGPGPREGRGTKSESQKRQRGSNEREKRERRGRRYGGAGAAKSTAQEEREKKQGRGPRRGK